MLLQNDLGKLIPFIFELEILSRNVVLDVRHPKPLFACTITRDDFERSALIFLKSPFKSITLSIIQFIVYSKKALKLLSSHSPSSEFLFS